jgi:lysophospholipase L1-like esterase
MPRHALRSARRIAFRHGSPKHNGSPKHASSPKHNGAPDHARRPRRRWTRLAVPPVLAALAWGAALATAPPASATAAGYTALGDSYSAGEGTRTYYANDACHRSPLAFPVLDAARLGAPLSFAACGGATVSSVLAGQLSSLSPDTGYLTITVGGNDVGFSSVIAQCAKPWPYTCTNNINAANAYIRNTLPGSLDNLYAQLRARAPNAHVVVVGYPRLFNGQQCNLLSRISPAEQAALNATADLLDATTAARAAAHGFAFLDPRGAWTHHAICDDAEWLNGLSNPTAESYHPNRAGQAGYADEVAAALVSGSA